MRRHHAASRSCAVLVIVATALAAAASPVQAKITKKTFTAQVRVKFGNYKYHPGQCSAVAVAEIPRYMGSVSATVTWHFNNRAALQTYPTGPLFDDVFYYVKEYQAPAEKHWFIISSGSRAGASPDDCSARAAKIRSLVSPTARVVLKRETDGDQICLNARAAAKAAYAKYRDARKAEQGQKNISRKQSLEQKRIAQGHRSDRAEQVRKEACRIGPFRRLLVR